MKLLKNIFFILITVRMSTQHIALVVDRSGSMSGKEGDTIGGINACIEELKNQKEETDEIYITLKWFDHEQLLLHDKIDIDQYNPLAVSDFKPRGQTALLDAMGDTINHFITMKQSNPTAFNSCMIYVATDGLENCSRKYTKSGMKTLIESAKNNHDIMVIYMAANQDAILEAGSMGIGSGQAINYNESSENTRAVYSSAARVAHRSRTGGNTNFLSAERQASQPASSPPTINRQAAHSRSAPSAPNAPRMPRFTGTPPIPAYPVSSLPPPSPTLTPIPAHRSNTMPTPSSGSSLIPEMWKQHVFLDAAKDRNWAAITGYLNETPSLINVVGGNANRWTALHQAAEENNQAMIIYLLDKGADKNIRNRDGHLPIELTSVPAARELLEETVPAPVAMLT